jgi:hypothetical protein
MTKRTEMPAKPARETIHWLDATGGALRALTYLLRVAPADAACPELEQVRDEQGRLDGAFEDFACLLRMRAKDDGGVTFADLAPADLDGGEVDWDAMMEASPELRAAEARLTELQEQRKRIYPHDPVTESFRLHRDHLAAEVWRKLKARSAEPAVAEIDEREELRRRRFESVRLEKPDLGRKRDNGSSSRSF